MGTRRTAAAAQFLFDSHQARATFAPIPDSCRPQSIEDAYDVQEEFQRLIMKAQQDRIAGYKVAAISPVMQELLDINEPCGGAIFSRRIRRSPARLDARDFVHLAVECEIAVILGTDLEPLKRQFTMDDVAPAVATCAAAIELIEDRHSDYGKLKALDLIADNCWNAGIVIGPELADWQSLDLRAIKGAMYFVDRFMGEGRGSDVGGHPFESVAWIANLLARRNMKLRRGMVVMTGSVVSTQFPKIGDRVRVVMEGLGETSLVLS